jgi:hypothetical protein
MVTLIFQYNAKSGSFLKPIFFLLTVHLVLDHLLQSPLWRYYSFLHSTLAKKQNVNNLIKQIKSIIIKKGDVLILVKITQVHLFNNLCLDFNFIKNWMKFDPFMLKLGFYGPQTRVLWPK